MSKSVPDILIEEINAAIRAVCSTYEVKRSQVIAALEICKLHEFKLLMESQPDNDDL